MSVDLLLSHLWKAEIPWIFFFFGGYGLFLLVYVFFFNVLSSFMPISSYLLVLLQKSFSEKKKQKSYHVNRFCRTFSNIYGFDGGFERIKEVRSWYDGKPLPSKNSIEVKSLCTNWIQYFGYKEK